MVSGSGRAATSRPSRAKHRDEIFRNLGKQTLDDDPVERANPWRDRQAIAKDDPGIGDTEPREPRLGLDREALNRSMETTSRASRASKRRRIARSGSDFEHAMTRQWRQRFDHPGGEPGLRKGLATPQGQRDCAARQIGKTVRHENLARHDFERTQKIEILDAARAEVHQKRRLVLRLDRLFLGSERRLVEKHRKVCHG